MTVLKFPSSQNITYDILKHYMDNIENIEQMAIIVKEKDGNVAVSYNVMDVLNMIGLLEAAKITLMQELFGE